MQQSLPRGFGTRNLPALLAAGGECARLGPSGQGAEMSETFGELELREWSDAAVARAYARDFAQASQMCVPGLVAATGAETRRATDVLDLCCGHGNVSEGLVAAGASVTSADFSPAMLDLARARVPQATFVQADAMDLPFDAGRFDAVTIGFGLPHVPDPPKVMAECARVPKPGGRIAYTVWHGAEKTSALATVFKAIAEHGDPDIALPPGPGATDYAQPDIAFPALGAAGFTECQLTTIPSAWTADDPAAPFRFFIEGTARGGYLLRNQPPDAARAIKAEVEAWTHATCGNGPPWTIPIPAALISATRV